MSRWQLPRKPKKASGPTVEEKLQPNTQTRRAAQRAANRGRECHTQQSETKKDLQTVQRRGRGERRGAVGPQRRAAVGKPIDTFRSKSADRQTPTRPVACLPHPPSPTQTDVSRCGGTHIPDGTAAPARTPDPHRAGSPNTTTTPKKTTTKRVYFKAHSRSFYQPYYSRGEFILRLSERLQSMRRAAAAPHFLPRRLRSPEKHLSRCHEKRVVRTRCVNRSDCFRERVRGFV